MFKKIEAACQRLKGYANDTPVLTSSTLNQQLDCEFFFKCESFQRVGTFKFRGAFNSISQLSDDQKLKGIIAYSSGNHAQAIACVGKMLGVKTTCIMPSNAPSIKLEATKDYGARVITYDSDKQTREQLTTEILAQNDLTLIPPFDYLPVIAGQGTVAYEFLQSHPELDMILAPCGGGGLLSGTAVAVKNIRPECQVIGVEPEVANDATLSFNTGKLHVKPNPPTIADGTRTASLGKLTFPLIQKHVDKMVVVTEESIMEAVRFFFYRMKIVVEPSGALGLAALISGAVNPKGKIGIIVSGGNIDGHTMMQILTK